MFEDEQTLLAERFNVTAVEIACPFMDGWMLKIEIGWVNPEAPTLHFNCPELVQHFRSEHGEVWTG